MPTTTSAENAVKAAGVYIKAVLRYKGASGEPLPLETTELVGFNVV